MLNHSGSIARSLLKIKYKKFFSLSYKFIQNETTNIYEIHLESDKKGKFLPFSIDFTSPSFMKRLKSSNTELINKAIGKKSSIIIDFTAGLGRDSLLMASTGKKVIMCERDPVISKLLKQALDQLEKKTPELRKNIYLVESDIVKDSSMFTPLFQSLKEEIEKNTGMTPLVSCYLDPMYPEKPSERKAASKKDTQILHTILGDPLQSNDQELFSMFALAHSLSSDKIVIKRSLGSPLLLSGISPSSTCTGSTQRFDVYHRDNFKNSDLDSLASALGVNNIL